jgi:hypothetical protein
MLTTPDLRLFWTAYDPLDLASGSIDVLGFQAGYLALANKLLPGFTTVTTSPRYVSMLCAAVAAAEAAVSGSGEAGTRVREARMEAVKSYERAWALACGLTAEATIGEKAVDGLRGVQSIRRRLSELSARDKAIRTSSFNLLANQVRYGGIGAYSTLLEDCHLATLRSVTLRPLGVRLAEAFPAPNGGLAVWEEERALPLDALREWGSRCHLGDFTREEGRGLIEALRGGEESGRADDVRWTTLRMLAAFAEDGLREPLLFQRLLDALRGGECDRLKVPPACLSQVEAALVLIGPYERLYQGVQFLFDAVRAAATDEPEARLGAVADAPPCVAAIQGVRAAASALRAALEDAVAVHAQTAHDVHAVLAGAGVVAFAEASLGVPDGASLVAMVLDRHRDVQHGKFDRGERKAAWVLCDTGNVTARLTAQRHQLPQSDRYDTWSQVPWHPYRTYGAWRFVKACGIR